MRMTIANTLFNLTEKEKASIQKNNEIWQSIFEKWIDCLKDKIIFTNEEKKRNSLVLMVREFKAFYKYIKILEKQISKEEDKKEEREGNLAKQKKRPFI